MRRGAALMREALAREIEALIDRLADGARDDAARDALLSKVAAWQREHVAPVARLAARRDDPLGFPAVPTDVFRYVRVAAHPPAEDARVFRTSGTTSGQRGASCLSTLSLYDRAAEAEARRALFFDGPMRLVMLAPHPDEAPDSSLSYMLGRFEDWFVDPSAETGARWVFSEGRLDARALSEALETDAPTAVLGTSFAFVHAEDALDARFALPAGSFVMQTGGFKGRSREVAPDVLRAQIAARYGLAEDRVVSEYGMTELSSQMYEAALREAGSRDPRRYAVPGWLRVTAVDPETLAPLPDGAPGLLRIDDLANLDTSCGVQTSDVATVHAQGASLELHGRAPGATPRGCSLAVEEALDDR